MPEPAAAAEDEDYDEAINQGKDRPVGITTLDRRPGRPPFHHMGPMGPPPSGPAFERRQKLMELRRRQSMLQRRLGMLAQQSEVRERVAPVSPVVEAKRMLRRFGGMVELAKSEVAMIRDIARYFSTAVAAVSVTI